MPFLCSLTQKLSRMWIFFKKKNDKKNLKIGETSCKMMIKFMIYIKSIFYLNFCLHYALFYSMEHNKGKKKYSKNKAYIKKIIYFFDSNCDFTSNFFPSFQFEVTEVSQNGVCGVLWRIFHLKRSQTGCSRLRLHICGGKWFKSCDNSWPPGKEVVFNSCLGWT